MNISFPIIMVLDGHFYLDTVESAGAAGFEISKEGTLLLKETEVTMGNGFIIDDKGFFYELSPKGKRKEFLRFLSFLWRFVKSEYCIKYKPDVAVLEVLELLNDKCKVNKKTRLYKDFLCFLEKYKHEKLSEDLLKKWPL